MSQTLRANTQQLRGIVNYYSVPMSVGCEEPSRPNNDEHTIEVHDSSQTDVYPHTSSHIMKFYSVLMSVWLPDCVRIHNSCEEFWTNVLCSRVFVCEDIHISAFRRRVGVCMCALARTCVHIQQLRGILNFFTVLMSVSLRGSLYVCVFSWRGGLSVLQKRRRGR